MILFSIPRISFGIDQESKLSRALELFENKIYGEAEPIFRSLISEKPDELDLYYYYGACRTENGNYSEYDLIQLLNANSPESPKKIDYYLGIQYQAQENWEQALKHFNKFRVNSTEQEQNELEVASKIQQCFNNENPYKNLVKEISEEFPTPNNTSSISDNEEQTNISSEIVPIQNENSESVNDKPIEFTVNSQITYYNFKNFQTQEGQLLFEESQQKKQRLDSILNRTNELRAQYLTASSAEKETLGKIIVNLETESYPLQQEITDLLLHAQEKELEYWNNASDEEISEFLNNVEKEQKLREQETVKSLEKEVETDSSLLYPEFFVTEKPGDILLEEPEKKDELIYRIQIGAYSKGLPAYVDRLFKKLSVIRKIDNYTDDRGVVVYTTGKLTNLDDAIKLQQQVRQEGVEDAFVVPYFNGKRITLNEAKKIASEL